MDKIREEFEKEYDVIEFRLDSDFPMFEAGYKSRDEEIAELHESCNNYKKMYVDKREEIKKLRDVIKELEKQLDKTRRDTPPVFTSIILLSLRISS